MEPYQVYHFCPACGNNDLHVDDKHMTCKRCSFEGFFNASVAVAAVIVNEENEALLSKRARDPKKDCYDLPGGFVDKGETLEEALARELKEELGLTVNPTDFEYVCSAVNNDYIFNGINVAPTDVCFFLEIAKDTELKAQDDINEIEWVSLGNNPEQKVVWDSAKKALEIVKIYCSDNKDGIYGVSNY